MTRDRWLPPFPRLGEPWELKRVRIRTDQGKTNGRVYSSIKGKADPWFLALFPLMEGDKLCRA